MHHHALKFSLSFCEKRKCIDVCSFRHAKLYRVGIICCDRATTIDVTIRCNEKREEHIIA